MALLEVDQVVSRKRTQEKAMPTNPNQMDLSPTDDMEPDVDDAVAAALDEAKDDAQSVKSLAEAEEKFMALRVAAARAAATEAEASAPPAEDLTELPLATLAMQGRDAVLEAMRQHQEKKASEPVYVPSPRTARQTEILNAELEAGRRAQQRHQTAMEENRKVHARLQEEERQMKIARGEADASTLPVHRNGLAVPDPQTGKSGTYSPTA